MPLNKETKPNQTEPMYFGLVWLNGTSIIAGYLMLNPFLYIKTVLFQTIQFSISIQFSSI